MERALGWNECVVQITYFLQVRCADICPHDEGESSLGSWLRFIHSSLLKKKKTWSVNRSLTLVIKMIDLKLRGYDQVPKSYGKPLVQQNDDRWAINDKAINEKTQKKWNVICKIHQELNIVNDPQEIINDFIHLVHFDSCRAANKQHLAGTTSWRAHLSCSILIFIVSSSETCVSSSLHLLEPLRSIFSPGRSSLRCFPNLEY